MGNNKQPQTVNIEGAEYRLDDFTPEQANLLNHVVDLDRKLSSCLFQADQLRIGKDAFLGMLKQSIAVGKLQPVAPAADTPETPAAE
jgi:hypothetical protein